MPKMKDLTGQRFGRLTVLRQGVTKRSPKGVPSVTWECLCDCGVLVTIRAGDLLAGRSQSCGCLHREIVTTHGDAHDNSQTRLYKIWADMKSRCNNPNVRGYHRYGGRGIQVCEEWQHSFGAFKGWALSHGYSANLTIDRIDNDGDYCPDNCRWATAKEQANNRSTNRKVACL